MHPQSCGCRDALHACNTPGASAAMSTSQLPAQVANDLKILPAAASSAAFCTAGCGAAGAGMQHVMKQKRATLVKVAHLDVHASAKGLEVVCQLERKLPAVEAQAAFSSLPGDEGEHRGHKASCPCQVTRPKKPRHVLALAAAVNSHQAKQPMIATSGRTGCWQSQWSGARGWMKLCLQLASCRETDPFGNF